MVLQTNVMSYGGDGKVVSAAAKPQTAKNDAVARYRAKWDRVLGR
jgi:hypothetical protein